MDENKNIGISDMPEGIQGEEMKNEEIYAAEAGSEETRTPAAESETAQCSDNAAHEEISEEPDEGENAPAIREKRSAGKSLKASFGSRKFKGGAYAMLLSAIVLVVFVAINLIVSELDVSIDLTSDEKYTLTDATKELVSGISDEIDIYYLSEEGSELEMFKRIMDNFEAAGGNVRVITKDPIKYPKFASAYTEESITQHSVIVVNQTNGRSKYVPYSDMLVQEFNSQTYSYDTTGIDVEGQLVSALRYVVTDDIPLMYTVGGHGEATASADMTSAISKENMETKSINLLTGGGIPEDCDILFIYQPQNDYAEEEVALIKDYMSKGGRVMMLADYTMSEMPNLAGLLQYYGIDLVNGFVIEGDSDYNVNNYPYVLVPKISTHDITSGIKDERFIVMPVTAGMKFREDARSTITLTGLLETSEDAYSKTNVNTSTIEHEDIDVDGPFFVGAEMTEEYNGVKSQLVVFTSKDFLQDGYFNYSTYGNADMFLNSLTYLADAGVSVSTRTTSLTEEVVTLTSAQANRLAIIYIVLLPLAIIGVGIYVIVKRRKA